MRQPRILVEGAWYHVTVRANRREMLLDSGEIRDLFMLFVRRAKEKYSFSVANFCVLGNHVHLQVQPARGESLSDIMRWLLGNFARAYNKKRGWTGHFWGDRFHSRVLEGFRQFAIAFEYIDGNPVKACLAVVACLWRHCGAWHWRIGDRAILGDPDCWISFLAASRGMPPTLAEPREGQSPQPNLPSLQAQTIESRPEGQPRGHEPRFPRSY